MNVNESTTRELSEAPRATGESEEVSRHFNWSNWQTLMKLNRVLTIKWWTVIPVRDDQSRQGVRFVLLILHILTLYNLTYNRTIMYSTQYSPCTVGSLHASVLYRQSGPGHLLHCYSLLLHCHAVPSKVWKQTNTRNSSKTQSMKTDKSTAHFFCLKYESQKNGNTQWHSRESGRTHIFLGREV